MERAKRKPSPDEPGRHPPDRGGLGRRVLGLDGRDLRMPELDEIEAAVRNIGATTAEPVTPKSSGHTISAVPIDWATPTRNGNDGVGHLRPTSRKSGGVRDLAVNLSHSVFKTLSADSQIPTAVSIYMDSVQPAGYTRLDNELISPLSIMEPYQFDVVTTTSTNDSLTPTGETCEYGSYCIDLNFSVRCNTVTCRPVSFKLKHWIAVMSTITAIVGIIGIIHRYL